jgi:hypothetical protein
VLFMSQFWKVRMSWTRHVRLPTGELSGERSLTGRIETLNKNLFLIIRQPRSKNWSTVLIKRFFQSPLDLREYGFMIHSGVQRWRNHVGQPYWGPQFAEKVQW